MNYEKIIIELLGRIQVLEEQVATLMNEKNQALQFAPVCADFVASFGFLRHRAF